MTFDWTGDWAVEAIVPGGGSYAGIIRMRPFGDGFRLDWDISDGVYFGVGLPTPAGLFVSCGPALEGLSLIVFDKDGDGRWLGANSDADDCGGTIRAEASGEGVWRLSGSGARGARLSPNGDAKLAAIETEAGPRDGLAWRSGSETALAWGCALDRLVVLHYPTPGREDGPVEGHWALGRIPEIGTERLLRRR